MARLCIQRGGQGQLLGLGVARAYVCARERVCVLMVIQADPDDLSFMSVHVQQNNLAL